MISHARYRDQYSCVSFAAEQNAYSHQPLVSGRFGPLLKTVSFNFFHSIFPLVHESSGGLVWEPREKAEVIASRFVSSSLLPNNPPTKPLFLPVFSTRNIHQAVSSLNVSKPSGPDSFHPSSLKCVPLSWPFLRCFFHPSFKLSDFSVSWKNCDFPYF